MASLNRYYIINRLGNLFIKDRKTKTIVDHEETTIYNVEKRKQLKQLCKNLNEET